MMIRFAIDGEVFAGGHTECLLEGGRPGQD